MSATLSAPAPAQRRTFAQLPLNKPFRDVCNHVNALHGACLTQLSADERSENPYLTFIFQGHRFRGEDVFGRLHLSVESVQCPERVVFQVLNHFSWLLASRFGE